MKSIILALTILIILTGTAFSSDLYEVYVNDNTETDLLISFNAEPLIHINGGYLVLIDQEYLQDFLKSGLEYKLIQNNIQKDEIFLDGRMDEKNLEILTPLYIEGNTRLFRIDKHSFSLDENRVELFPLRNDFLEIKYYPPKDNNILALDLGIGLDSLVNRISQDSLDSYLHRLEAFNGRLVGTDSNYAARDWIEAKYRSFGYDSVLLDSFTGQQLWGRTPLPSYNVVAYKIGTEYPDQQIVIGGHFDAVPTSPGADDNGSGTVGTLEIARAFADIETPMTLVFIAFDSEESGLLGAYHYASSALERGDDIVLMLNMDMIGFINNSSTAKLYYGVEDSYALLWNQLAGSLFGITGGLMGSASNSDHAAFQNAGYDVVFVHEGIFSTHYHSPSDSTTYIDFEYATRMVRATLATAYNVMNVPPPVRITLIEDPGDGQSLNIYWEGFDPSIINHYSLRYYPTGSSSSINALNLSSTTNSYTVTGLQDLTEYTFYVRAFDLDGDSAFAYDLYYETPSSIPTAPFNVQGTSLYEAVQLDWRSLNDELDFNHFGIIRDNALIATTTDTFYIDNSPLLGSAYHSYMVVAVDTDDNISDTVGVEPIVIRAATLDPGYILAINRSTTGSINYLDEVETGVFLREALDGYNFTYYSDTSSSNSITLDEMLDYEMVIVGDESGRGVDITHYRRPIIADLAHYMSIGGKLIIFGRYGDLGEVDTIDYSTTYDEDDRYFYDYFHINYRVTTETRLALPDSMLSDLIGAYNVQSEYPYLAWDSLQTMEHSDPYIVNSGIPLASFVNLSSPSLDILYTYVSRDGNPNSQGKPVAWRHRGVDYRYIFMDLPLSFFNRDSAIVALRTAVDDLLYGATAIDDEEDNILPVKYTLYQNYPNPFNPITRIDYSLPITSNVTIKVYNILGQEVKTLVNGREKPGHKTVYWDGKNNADKTVATGLYLYRLTANNYTETKKMLLLK